MFLQWRVYVPFINSSRFTFNTCIVLEVYLNKRFFFFPEGKKKDGVDDNNFIPELFLNLVLENSGGERKKAVLVESLERLSSRKM